MGVGKAADDQIGLADAATPGAEQKLLAPLVQAFARSFRHGGSEKTPKARTRPGEGYIENGGEDVSGYYRHPEVLGQRPSLEGRRPRRLGRILRGPLRGHLRMTEDRLMRPPILNPLFAALSALPG